MTRPCLAALIPFALPSPALAQQRVIDTGTLIISRAGAVIGREEFVVRVGRASTGREGFTISANAFYPSERTQASVVPVVELGPDSQPASLQIDAGQQRVFAQIGARRVTVRMVSPQGESVREYPGGERLLVADDSSFALQAIPPGRTAGTVSLVWPRAGRRESGSLEDRGTERTELGAGAAALRHYVLKAGGTERHLWYDERGRLMKVELPAGSLSAVRAPEPGR